MAASMVFRSPGPLRLTPAVIVRMRNLCFGSGGLVWIARVECQTLIDGASRIINRAWARIFSILARLEFSQGSPQGCKKRVKQSNRTLQGGKTSAGNCGTLLGAPPN